MSSFDWRRDCAVVIPCLDEAATIAAIVRGARVHVDSVLVIDDGSTDRTGEIAVQAGAEVLRNPESQGKGAALRQGWNRALANGCNWALSLDGDGQHSPGDIPAFFHCAERTSALLVVGNRMGDTGPMPLSRRLVNRWLSRRLSAAARRPLPDSQCGFRLMNLPAWEPLHTRTTHFQIESEVLLSFARAGHRVEFVPICALYTGQHSKIHPLRDTVRWFRWWLGARRQ